MTHEVTVTYTRELIYKAVKHFWVRTIAWHGFMAFGLSLALFFYLLSVGDRSWLLGAMAVTSFFGAAMGVSVYWVYLKRSLWKFDKMPTKSITFTFTEDTFSSTSDLGNSETSWKAIEQIWRFPDVWLLFVARTVYFTLPVADLDKTTTAFIEEQVVKHGGKVA